MENNELQHWGVRGMRWGVRRYQNKDGTLTAAGKKRYDKEIEKLKEEKKVARNKQRTKAKLDKLDSMRKEIDDMNKSTAGKSKAKVENVKAKKQRAKEMSDDELKKVVSRLELEQRYKSLNQAQVSRGKKFVDGMVQNAVVPAIQEASKSLLKKAIVAAVTNAAETTTDKVHTRQVQNAAIDILKEKRAERAKAGGS